MQMTSRFIRTGPSWQLDTREPGRSRGGKRMSVVMTAAGGLVQWWPLVSLPGLIPFPTAFPFSVYFSVLE